MKRSWLARIFQQLFSPTHQRPSPGRRLFQPGLTLKVVTLESRVVPTIAPALEWTLAEDFGNGAVMLRTRYDALEPSTESPPTEEGGSIRPPMNLNGNGLQFNLIPVDGISAQAIEGFQAAANLWSAILRDDIMVNIEIGFTALAPGILGQAGSATQANSFSFVKSALAADAKSLSDQAVVANLPGGNALSLYTSDQNTLAAEIDNNGTVNNTTLDVNTANAKALGMLAANDSVVDGGITFSSGFSWDFDRSNGITGGFDFIGVAAHEIGHVLGFVSGADSVDYFSSGAPGGPLNLDGFRVISPLDLFRYSVASEAVGAHIDIRADTAVKYFSVDGGTTQITRFSTGSFHGDGRQASHWKDDLGIGIMDPTAAPSEYADITDFDVQAVDAMGWDVAMDLGDAPDTGFGTGSANYRTNLGDNGPRHLLFKASGLISDEIGRPKVYLGASVSGELTSLQNGTATGDITDNGIASFPTLSRGSTPSVTVTSTGAGAKLNYFFDFNKDGDFLDAGEFFPEVILSSTSQSVPVVIPAGALGGTTFARFRISSTGGLTSVGAANDGEVEDYQITITNGVPVAIASNVTTNEDIAKAFVATDFLFSDLEDDSLASITISSLSLTSGDTLRLSGIDVLANQTIPAGVIPNLIYTPAPNANGNARSSFNFTVNDSGTGTVVAAMTINVAAVNDVPVAQASNVTTNEDTAKQFAASDFLFADVDSDSLASITISSLSLTSGDTLRLSGIDVLANQTIPAGVIPNLIYTPAPNANGNARSSFNFTVNDSGTGTVVAAMTINVAAVNDVPVAQVSSATTNEDTAKAFAVTDFLFSDLESNGLASITISSLSLASGDTLKLSGIDVLVNQTILAGAIPNLVYTPAPNANGNARSSFGFRVNDSQSGLVTATMTINVDAINDVPVVQVSGVTTNEDTAKIFAVTDFLFTDVESNDLTSITLSSLGLSEGDTLELSGIDVLVNQTILAGDIANLVYMPAPNANGNARSSFAFTVNDSGSGVVAATMTVDVTPVNDTPVAQASSASTVEDTAKSFAVSDFLFTDVETDSLSSIAINSLTLASGDTLKLSGTDVIAGQTILAGDLASLVYLPAPDTNGNARSSFSFTVNDAENGTVDATLTINVLLVNDLPVMDTSFTPMLPALAMPQPKNSVIPGTPISTLVANVTDADPDPQGIAVTGYDDSRGQWQFSVDNGAIWTSFESVGTISDNSALLLADDGMSRVRFIPDKASKGVKAFKKGFADLTYRAWDQSDVATPVNPLVDTTNSPNTSFSSESERVWVMVGKTTPVVDVDGHPVLKAIRIPKGVPQTPRPSPVYTVKKFLGLLARETDPTKVFGIAISDASGTGEWQFNTGKGGWKLVGAVSESEALLLRPTDRVRFMKGPSFNGHAELTYHTWDMTAGDFGTKDSAIGAGFSIATETAIANAAPVLSLVDPSLGPVQAGAPPTPPTSISTLLGGAATDVEQSALGMYVYAPRGGTWEYSLNGIDWVKVTKRVYLVSTAQIRFTATTMAKVGAVASLSFKAWDQTVKSPATLSKAMGKITVAIIA